MILTTGCASFIGGHAADYFLREGLAEQVTGLDNLSRCGKSENLAWLQSKYGGAIIPVTTGDGYPSDHRI